ncbi:MAG: helix-turn-helix transcriptional regulator [Bacteroidales bacterium]|nr:helix-turn-helix transcriptional regulator [Bacteroidales bacterium]
MNQRLQQFLQAENLSQSQFADSINVARASVSHILAGRNKPGFEFIESMSRRYPSLNLEWLVTGKGKMYKNTAAAPQNAVSAPAEATPDPPADLFPDIPTTESNTLFSEQKQPKPQIFTKQQAASAKPRAISRIVVFYDDGTYQELK